MKPEEFIIEQLIEKGLTLATAESCTGGLVSHRLTNVPGASAVFLGGIVAYSNDIKQKLLGVSDSILMQFGAVSEPVAEEMAKGICRLTGSSLGIGITGIAGPGGGSLTKPVGLVYISVTYSKQDYIKVYKFHFSGNRQEIKQQTSDNALSLLIDTLNIFDKKE